MKKIFLTCIVLTAALSVAHAQEWTIEMDSVLQVLERDSLFDGQILIAQDGNVLFNKSYGHYADAASLRPVTNQTSLSVYSVGKSFTALAVMLLKEKGLLDYENKVHTFIPGFPYREVTIRHLLTMTSGLPRFLETALKYADTTTVLSNSGIIELIIKQKPGAGIPGAEFSYNNSNYILLGSIVEKVSGVPFAEFLDENIFKPLKMEDTYETASAKVDSLSKTVTNTNNFYQTFGAGSIATTATDLLKYDQALYSGKIIDPVKLMKAFECVKLADSSYSNYGFGWRINNCEDLKEVYHVGDGTNMRASIQRFLDRRNTLIYIHPTSNEYHEDVYHTVRNIWEGKEYQLPQKRIIHQIDTSLYNKYIGSYLSNFGLVHISTEKGKLFLRPDPIPGKEELVPSSDTTFYFRNQNLEWEFFLDEDGEVAGFGIKGDRNNMGLKQQ